MDRALIRPRSFCHYNDGNTDLEVSMIRARSQYSMYVVIVTGYIAAGSTTVFAQANCREPAR